MGNYTKNTNTETFYNNYLQNSYYKVQNNWDDDRQYRGYLIKNFLEFFPKDKKSNVLDIGIGDGKTLRAFKEFGYVNYFGIDIAEDLIKEAKTRDLACEHVKNTVAFLDLNKNKYSLVSIFHVIEHISKQESVDFLERIKESLTEDGKVIIVTPSVQNIFYVGPFWDFTHVNFFTERSLSQLCEAAGFKEINVRSERVPINIYGNGFLNYFRLLVSDIVIKFIQIVVNSFIRFLRFGIGTINPKILSPNLVCICKK
jgi:2-polyprenyl-3-methyl-5-hydroxy-6-metoxy-1,4-benzoquinol methylase